MKYKDYQKLKFEDLSQMYKDNPEDFSKETDELFEDFISNLDCPDNQKNKLKQTQWKIQGELRKYKDPVARLNKMIELFWKGFKEFQTELNKCKIELKEVKNADD